MPHATLPFPATDTERRRLTRAAGLAYLVIICAGVWGEGVVRSSLFHPGDMQATAEAIRSSLSLFRASVLADCVMALADVTLGVLLYLLLAPLAPGLALLALVLRLVQAAAIAASLASLAAIPAALEAGHDIMVLHAMETHGVGYDIGLIFFGINCLVMMVLLLRSPVPALIAGGIGGAGLVYLAGSTVYLLAPDLLPLIQPAYLLPLLAETALCLWLLIRARI